MPRKKPAPTTSPAPEPEPEAESSTPTEAGQETTQTQEEVVADPEPEPAPDPVEKPKRGRPRKAKPCLDPLKVEVGSVVRYWLPLAGANAKLIDASVAKVTAGKDKTIPPALELNYPNKAGKVQVREVVQYVGHRPTKKGQAGSWLQSRTGKWMEFPAPPSE